MFFIFFHIIRLLSTPLSLTWIMTFLLKVLIINILSIFIPLYTLQRLHNTTQRTVKMNIFIAEETAFGLEQKLFQWWLGCGRYRVPYVKFLCLWFIRSSPVWLTSYFFNKKLGKNLIINFIFNSFKRCCIFASKIMYQLSIQVITCK